MPFLTNAGYRVESTGKTEPGEIGYWVYGKRGATYGLLRSHHDPYTMFAVNARRFNVSARLRGYNWFTDESGVPEPIN